MTSKEIQENPQKYERFSKTKKKSILLLAVFLGCFASLESVFAFDTIDSATPVSLIMSEKPANGARLHDLVTNTVREIENQQKAVKDFKTRFNQVDNASWYSDDAGFLSYFIREGKGNRVVYDKKGNWQYSLLFYSEEKLPAAVRVTVKTVYYGWTIAIVEEVQHPEGTAYLVTIENKSEIRILKLNSTGDLELLAEMEKG